MRGSFSISQKIWFSLSILILGYLFSMVQFFYLGRQAESRIEYVSGTLFPASQKCYSALSAFKEQAKLCDDAIRLKDVSLLDVAKIKASWSRYELEYILSLPSIEDRNLNAIKDLIRVLDDFTSSSWIEYKQIITHSGLNEDISSISDKTAELTQQSNDILSMLEVLANFYSDDLRAELTHINSVSLRYRYINLYSFIGVVIFALTLIFLIITRSIVKPLQKTFMLETVVKQANDGIAVTDLTDKIIYANRAWGNMHGFDQEVLIGESMTRFHSSEQFDNEYFPVYQTAHNNGLGTGEVYHQNINGHFFPTFTSISQIINEQGEIFGYVHSIKDITIQKHREKELEETKKELLISEKMATLGRLTATVSHELRNPLGTIRASVFSIEKRLKGQDVKVIAALERAERNIKRCDLIIDELLNYSRVQELMLEPAMLDVWVKEVLDETKQPSGILIKAELSSGAIIEIDQERFRRCLINILTNAYQAIEEKGADEPGYVTVSTRKEDNVIQLEISDNGIGFDMAIKSKLFEPLFSTKAFGVGLGIPISRQIIEQHGFQMDMRGEPGKGASVTITIPVLKKNKK